MIEPKVKTFDEIWNSNAKEKMDSKCPKDYKDKHYWEPIGIVLTGFNSNIDQIFRCYQCRKIVRWRLEEL